MKFDINKRNRWCIRAYIIAVLIAAAVCISLIAVNVVLKLSVNVETTDTEESPTPPIKQAAVEIITPPATIEKPPPDEEENYEAADPQYYVVYPIKGYSKIMLFCDGYTGHKYIVTKWGGIARLEPVEWEVNR